MLALLAHLRGQRSAAAKGYVPVRLRPMQGRFDHETAMAQLEELKREREALEGSYADFNARLEKLRERWKTGEIPPPAPEFAELLPLLGNYLEMEREQVAKLFALLLDTYRELAGGRAHAEPRSGAHELGLDVLGLGLSDPAGGILSRCR
jgi:hypothetical protein